MILRNFASCLTTTASERRLSCHRGQPCREPVPSVLRKRQARKGSPSNRRANTAGLSCFHRGASTMPLAESWLFDEVACALGPRGVAADMESLGGKSNRSKNSSGNKSHRSHGSHKSHRSHRSHRPRYPLHRRRKSSNESVDSKNSRNSQNSRYSHWSTRSCYLSRRCQNRAAVWQMRLVASRNAARHGGLTRSEW